MFLLGDEDRDEDEAEGRTHQHPPWQVEEGTGGGIGTTPAFFHRQNGMQDSFPLRMN